MQKKQKKTSQIFIFLQSSIKVWPEAILHPLELVDPSLMKSCFPILLSDTRFKVEKLVLHLHYFAFCCCFFFLPAVPSLFYLFKLFSLISQKINSFRLLIAGSIYYSNQRIVPFPDPIVLHFPTDCDSYALSRKCILFAKQVLSEWRVHYLNDGDEPCCLLCGGKNDVNVR